MKVTNRFKGLDLIECLKNHGWRFITLYRRQWSKPSPRKRNAKRQNDYLRRPYKYLWIEEKWKAKEKRKGQKTKKKKWTKDLNIFLQDDTKTDNRFLKIILSITSTKQMQIKTTVRYHFTHRRSPGEGNGNSLQYSCLENSMDRGAWWATVHEVTKSQTWLRD